MSIRLEQLSLSAGDFACGNLNLDVADGSYAVLMGRTGCGKTTLLETICGLRPSAGGRIFLGGVDVTHRRAAERGIGYVPQDAALFPTMTVRAQLGFALTIRKESRQSIADRVDSLARLLGITPLLDRLPAGLSGGERQRVALGRALSFRPRLLVLDEPLAALDDATREELHEVLAEAHRSSAVTTFHVTHSIADARALADSVWTLGDEGLVEGSLEVPLS